MSIDNLISRLNEYSQELIAYKLGGEFADACMAAGSALAALQAENEKLRAELDMYEEMYDESEGIVIIPEV